MKPETKAALRRVDWLRVINRLTTLVRAARHDPELQRDHETERGRAAAMHRSIDNVARKAVGCNAPAAPCDCALCLEERR